MSLTQSAQARVTATLIMLLTARPYGAFRDWVFRVSGADHSGQIGQAIADAGAFVAYQLPVYAAILLLAGASMNQMLAACGTAILILTISGRPYGVFLESCRRWFGVNRRDLLAVSAAVGALNVLPAGVAKPKATRSVSRFDLRSLSDDLVGVLVLAQSLERRVPHEPVRRPSA
jgi:hypothetical protein